MAAVGSPGPPVSVLLGSPASCAPLPCSGQLVLVFPKNSCALWLVHWEVSHCVPGSGLDTD